MTRPKRRVEATGIVGLGARAFMSRAMVDIDTRRKRAEVFDSDIVLCAT